MKLKFAVWISLAIYLLNLTSANNVEGIKGDHHQSIKGSHKDHSVLVFFKPNDLKSGKVLPIYFRGFDPSSSPPFLPRGEADSIPFSISKLPLLIDQFELQHGSPQAQAMENTLRECEMPPIKGETKFCATSVESMLDFVQQIMGPMTKFKGLSTKQEHVTSVTVYQNYSIVNEPREVAASKMVACHTMPYPYAIFYCHYQVGESKVFQVSLDGENGAKMEAIVVCHMDTSQWSPNHVSFRVLGIKPGSTPVCHFFPADNLVWVPLLDAEG